MKCYGCGRTEQFFGLCSEKETMNKSNKSITYVVMLRVRQEDKEGKKK